MTISDTIESYRKRRKQLFQILIGVGAVILVIIGIVLVGASLSGGGIAKLFATHTPTPTMTYTPTETPLPTETPTITLTPTITPTATASDVFDYTVKEGDTLTKIAQDQNLGENGLVLLYMLNPSIDPATGSILVGQVIKVPPPNSPILTPTPLPTGLAPGARITYFVLPNDFLGTIAAKFNSTLNAIILANPTALKNGESSIIYPGQLLIVPINIVTPVPSATAAGEVTATPTPTITDTPTVTYTPTT